jgi:nucleoid DNA-binding protein
VDASTAKKAVEAVFAGIVEAAKKGEEISLLSFGKFKVKDSAARQGRNPGTGETIEIAASRKLGFSPAKRCDRCCLLPLRRGFLRRCDHRREAAVIYDTERWALEFVPDGVRVNTVSPGSTLAEGNAWDRYRLTNQANFDDYVRHGFPMGRLGTPEEVANVIVFIASPRAHWINGRHVPVDGLSQPYTAIGMRPY